MRILIPTILFLVSLSTNASSFDDFKQKQKLQNQLLSKQENQQYNNYKKQHLADYTSFKKQYLADYDSFRKELLSLWASPTQSDVNSDVIYSKDKQTRVIIEKPTQKVTIETLKPISSIKAFIDNLNSDEHISKAILTSSKDDDEILSQIESQKVKVTVQISPDKVDKILAQEIIEQHENQLSQIDKSNNISQQDRLLRIKDIEDTKNNRVKILEKEQQLAKKKSAEYKNITSYSIKAPDDYLYKKVSKFIVYYKKEAEKNEQELALLLAISEAESSFNPEAKSYIPAFGLMQVVRGSAGLDVNQKIHKKNIYPTEKELYTPNINIEYGSNYIKILTLNYLRNIKDPISKKYCAIAAYNTGAGNVARAFNGFNNLKIVDAIPKINALSSEQVYQTLMTSLPYAATKKYLKTVTELEIKYQKNIINWNI